MDVLLVFLAVVAGVLLFTTLAALVAVLLGMRSLKRRNRVSPDHPTAAPITWLGSPVSPARLHRRLRSAVSVARMIQARHVATTGSRAVDLAAQLEAEAVGIDQHLAVVGRLAPAERKRLVRHLTGEVVRIEQIASRLSLLDADAAASARIPHHPNAMQDLADQLDQLEAARREVAETETHSGLRSPSPLPPPDSTKPRRGEG